MRGVDNPSSAMNIVSLLEKHPLFARIDRATLGQMARTFVLESWRKDREIAGSAESARNFRLIISGRVKIARGSADDAREITLWLLGRGDAFDIVSALDGQPHDVSAWALDEVETLAVPLPAFEQWLDRSEPLRLAMHRYVARQLRELTALASDLALHDTMMRLAGLLLRHFDPKAPSRGARVNLIRDLPQEELAALIGSVRVVVGRLFAELKREGVVELHRGNIRILDLKRLLDHAENQASRLRHRAHGRTAT